MEGTNEKHLRSLGARRSATIMNCPPRSAVVQSARCHASRPLKLLYQGLYFPYRGLEQAVAGVDGLDVELTFRGVGPYQKKIEKLASGRPSVRFEAPARVGKLIQLASEHHVGLSPFLPLCGNTIAALPNKFFEYMAAGLCVLSSDLPELRRVTEDYEVGMVFDPLSDDGLRKAVGYLADHPREVVDYGCQARQAIKSRFNWETEEQEIVRAYENLVH